MARLHYQTLPLSLVVIGLAACTPQVDDPFTSFATTMMASETSGDGDGDGDGDGTPGDGDGMPGDGDGMPGDGDGMPGDGDGMPGDGDGDGMPGPYCGDGVVDPGEECDVGPETMFCDGDCTYAVCGDGYHNMLSEQCDDGNEANDDACIFSCVLNVCGDGVVWVGMEECDDNNMVDTDACRADCTNAICGDGVIWQDMETCEDGNMVDTDDCTNTCQTAICGDGILWDGVETCDDGNMSDSDECPTSCEPAFCGDGFTQIGVEQCDDANQNDNDFCHNDCTTEGYYDDFETNNLLLLPWMSSGNANWGTLGTMPHQGSYVAGSGNIGHSQSTSLSVTLNAPANGVVRFWYRVSSEGNYDYLRFYIDNVQQGNGWSGNVAWAQAQYNITAGQHTFRWTYSKDGSVVVGEDKAYIDEVYIGL